MQSVGYVSGTLTRVWVQVGHLNRRKVVQLVMSCFKFTLLMINPVSSLHFIFSEVQHNIPLVEINVAGGAMHRISTQNIFSFPLVFILS